MSVDPPQTLQEILSLRAEKDADVAFVTTIRESSDGGIVNRSYQEILERSERLRATLEQFQVVGGETVGCYLANTPAWVVASFALWNSGAVVATVGTLLPGAEATRLFKVAGVRVVIRAVGSDDLGPEFEAILIDGEGFVQSNDAAPSMPLLPTLTVPASAVACIFFTSGTTGQPKGVTFTQEDFLKEARKVAGAYTESDSFRVRAASPELPPGVSFVAFGHIAGYGRLSSRMWMGRPIVLAPKFSVHSFGEILRRFDFDFFQLTPAAIYMLATTDDALPLERLQYVTSGTAPLAVATRERFESRYGIPVMQTYGMTEVGTVSQERFDDVVAGRRGPGSVGRIAEGVEVSIRNTSDGAPLESNEDGQIYVRTSLLPEQFIGGQVVPVDDDGWFGTGDVGHLDEHLILYITGRVQEKLVVGGFNVYPAEVEDAIRLSDQVLDAVVVGVADERLGELPVAGIVWVGDPDEDNLIRELRERLAHYKIPRSLFRLVEIPLTSRDKVDRRKVKAMAEQALGSSDSGSSV